jgi:glutamate N-acetyltransferase / amino-acid N-acetyltransferase
MKISPFAPAVLPHLPPIAGVRFATAQAGVKYQNRTDLLLTVFDPGTVVAGVFTRSKTASAPVDWCRAQMAHGQARGLVVNSGNANAFTGRKGVDTVAATVAAAAAALDCPTSAILVASTGVIGQPLDAAKLTPHLPALTRAAHAEGWEMAARAIMTTDTYPKLVTRTVVIDGVTITLNGMAKGAGMIQPDLGTMFAFVFTDAAIDHAVLQPMLAACADETLNCISIDSDTSTSDTVLGFATGTATQRGAQPIRDLHSAAAKAFAGALKAVLADLAGQIVRDGEGLTKVLSITITGAETDSAARRIGFAIANSPLFKTALAGCDPNWGRIVMAVGKSGEAVDRDQLSIRFGADLLVAEQGAVATTYTERAGADYFKGAELAVTVSVGVGNGAATVWTCDLTADYVAINADYRS